MKQTQVCRVAFAPSTCAQARAAGIQRLLVVVPLLCLGPTAQGATLELCSQNQLHLGYSSTDQNKVDALRGEFTNQFAATACDVVVLQETMRRALEAGPLPQGALQAIVPLPPLNYITAYTALLGKTTYKESYAFIVSTALPVVTEPSGAAKIWQPSATVAAKFARPPAAIVLMTGNAANGEWTWIVNFHAIWGKGVGDRQAEAIAMNEFAVELTTTPVDAHGSTSSRIVIGGDWNLATNNAAFNTMKTGTLAFSLDPNIDTSLTQAGLPSEPYDHFAWSNVVAVANARRLTPPSMPNWRLGVSDHMGVACTVTHP